jgi:hypothetical protein
MADGHRPGRLAYTTRHRVRLGLANDDLEPAGSRGLAPNVSAGAQKLGTAREARAGQAESWTGGSVAQHESSGVYNGEQAASDSGHLPCRAVAGSGGSGGWA